MLNTHSTTEHECCSLTNALQELHHFFFAAEICDVDDWALGQVRIRMLHTRLAFVDARQKLSEVGATV